MKIGEIANLTKLPVQTIRFYETKNLIKSIGRTEGNFRLYDANVIKELEFIKYTRNLDLSLNEIKHLIELRKNPSADCEEISIMIENHINQVDKKISELSSLRKQLKSLSKTCARDEQIKDCGILQKLTVNK